MIEDTLRRAVERLEDLRAKSTEGPWVRNGFEIHGPGTPSKRKEVVWEAPYEGGGLWEEADGDLIVTLHRTIDAQLAILNAGLVYFYEFYMAQGEGDYHYDDGHPMSPDRMYKITPEGRATVELAKAILGEA